MYFDIVCVCKFSSPFFFYPYLLQCEPGLGASVMYNLLYNKPQKLMLLAGCSTVCTTVAEAAKMWNLIVVSMKTIYVYYAIYTYAYVYVSLGASYVICLQCTPTATENRNGARPRFCQSIWARVCCAGRCKHYFNKTLSSEK